jgi:outer membrane protein assembly factor BamE (lipoprotein component of BamABCDE complex)
MKKFIFTIIIFLFFSNCSLNKVEKHHGVKFLEEKNKKLLTNKSNINDIRELLGPAIMKSAFDNNVLIYIERKTSSSKLTKLGKKDLLLNNVLVLEVNNRGLLVSKNFFNKESMNKVKFDTSTTDVNYSKKSFIYNFLSSVRQKANDPLGKKRIKN